MQLEKVAAYGLVKRRRFGVPDGLPEMALLVASEMSVFHTVVAE